MCQVLCSAHSIAEILETFSPSKPSLGARTFSAVGDTLSTLVLEPS